VNASRPSDEELLEHYRTMRARILFLAVASLLMAPVAPLLAWAPAVYGSRWLRVTGNYRARLDQEGREVVLPSAVPVKIARATGIILIAGWLLAVGLWLGGVL
jgi:hypothetical protein